MVAHAIVSGSPPLLHPRQCPGAHCPIVAAHPSLRFVNPRAPAVLSPGLAASTMGPLHLGGCASVRLVPALSRRSGICPSARAAAVDQHAAHLDPVDEVPIVDLAELRSCAHDQGIQRVASACRDWGFFQVVNHGVSMKFIHKFRKQCLDVFSLPREQKDNISRRTQGSRWGYDFRPDNGPLEVFQLNAWDSRQLLTFAHELFPNSNEDFVAVYKEANLVFRTLAIEILDILIQGLRVDAKHFQAHKNESQGVLRANLYHQSKAPDQVIGLIPHVDGNLFTILHQQDVSGLEVLKNGRWIPITPRNDAFCINVADIMQVLTNGEYKSVQHRAVVPKTQARLSFAYFLTPAEGVSLIPAPELVDSGHPPLYRPFTWADFVEASKGAVRPYPSVLPSFEQRHSQS